MGKMSYITTPETIASDLLACKNAFDVAGVPWVIIGGIVLGYARYNKIMDWDTDLDIGVFVELSKNRQTKLYNELRNNKFILKGNSDFIYGGRETPFNMMIYHKNGNFYESFPQTMKGFKYVEKAEWYDEPQIVEFLSDKYPMPQHIDDYVACHYGKGWKSNIVKNHEEYYLDKRGARGIANSSKWLSSRGGKHGDLWPKILRCEDTMEKK